MKLKPGDKVLITKSNPASGQFGIECLIGKTFVVTAKDFETNARGEMLWTGKIAVDASETKFNGQIYLVPDEYQKL